MNIDEMLDSLETPKFIYVDELPKEKIDKNAIYITSAGIGAGYDSYINIGGNASVWTELERVAGNRCEGDAKTIRTELKEKICKRCSGNLVYKGDGFYVCESCGTLHKEEKTW